MRQLKLLCQDGLCWRWAGLLQGRVDPPGDVSFHCSDCLTSGLASGLMAIEVVAGWWVLSATPYRTGPATCCCSASSSRCSSPSWPSWVSTFTEPTVRLLDALCTSSAIQRRMAPTGHEGESEQKASYTDGTFLPWIQTLLVELMHPATQSLAHGT